jgi:hypothetical protein
MKSHKERTKYAVTPERFITTWQTSPCVAAVVEKLQMPKPIVYARACNYRTAGVNLKRMPRRSHNRLDVAGLNRLTEELNGQQAEQGKAAGVSQGPSPLSPPTRRDGPVHDRRRLRTAGNAPNSPQASR